MLLLIDRGSNPQSWIIMIYLCLGLLDGNFHRTYTFQISLGLLQWNSIYVDLNPLNAKFEQEGIFFALQLFA